MVFNDAELRSRIDKLEEYVRDLQKGSNVSNVVDVASSSSPVSSTSEYVYQRCKGCRVVIAIYNPQAPSVYYMLGVDEVNKYWCPSCEPVERKRRLARSIADKTPDCVIAAWEEKAKVKGGKK